MLTCCCDHVGSVRVLACQTKASEFKPQFRPSLQYNGLCIDLLDKLRYLEQNEEQKVVLRLFPSNNKKSKKKSNYPETFKKFDICYWR